MKKYSVSLLALMLVSAPAFAQAVSVSPTSAAGDGATVSPSGTTVAYKYAVLAGQADAIRVLDGQAASDTFAQARVAAEALTGMTFATDREAAVAIVALVESVRAE